jgi:hypothetical protein
MNAWHKHFCKSIKVINNSRCTMGGPPHVVEIRVPQCRRAGRRSALDAVKRRLAMDSGTTTMRIQR